MRARSTRASLLRSLRNLTRAQRELTALLAEVPPGRRRSTDVSLAVRAFDDGLAVNLRHLQQELHQERQRTPEEVRHRERTWAYWRRQAHLALNYPLSAYARMRV